MDLDAVYASEAHCYNCNKIGHLSKDCPAPRKIKFNSKQTNEGRPKASLNLIDLDPLAEEPSTSNLFAIKPIIPKIDSWAKINNHLQKISNNLVKQLDKSIVVLNQQLWNQVEQEVEAQAVCKRIETTICPPKRKPLVFIPGAARHGIIRELELNHMSTVEPEENQQKRKHEDSVNLHHKRLQKSSMGYIDWERLGSNTETYNFKDKSLSKTSSIVWLGDSTPELQLNAISEKEKSLPR
jgi:hypothetical protein